MKHDAVGIFTKQSYTFNWTKVELKLNLQRYYDMLETSFNWTKVELKPALMVSYGQC